MVREFGPRTPSPLYGRPYKEDNMRISRGHETGLQIIEEGIRVRDLAAARLGSMTQQWTASQGSRQVVGVDETSRSVS